MPVIAIYALIAATLFGSGYGTCWKVMTRQIAVLNAQIEASNADAKRRLLESTVATETAELKAAETAKQLEDEALKNIELNADVGRRLAAVRMRVKTVHTNCSGTLPKSSSPSTPTDATDLTELPEEFAGLLRNESLRADNLAVYADECYHFVNNQCGIKQ